MPKEPIKFSVVIPAYNVDLYIQDCLVSLEEQIGQGFVMEVIVVDDGSTDETSSIVEKYKSTGLVNVYILQSNQGQSAARNLGIAKSSGDYVVFLDADDLLDVKAFEKLASVIGKENVDIVFYDADEFYDGLAVDERKLNTYSRPDALYEKKMSSANFFCESIRADRYNVSPCMFAVRREMLANVYFPEGITAEDNLFTTTMLLDNSNASVYVLSDKIYKRRLRPGSEVSRSNSVFYFNSYMAVFTGLGRLQCSEKELAQALNKFRGNILALALKTISRLEGLSVSEVKAMRNIVKTAIFNNISVLSVRVFVAYAFPNFYTRLAGVIKKMLWRLR